jgi:AAA15 family ATPase/GTPase
MLIEFSVGNYKSFKEIVTFSMAASTITAKDKEIDEKNVFSIDDELSLLKSASVYGANASGKSNLATAFSFMKNFVLNSSKETQVAEEIDVEEFRLSADTVGEPSFFQIVFLLDGNKFRYGFEVNKQRVVSEWLFYVPNTREAKLFVRELDDISLSKAFKEGRGIKNKTRENALFLSVVAQFNGEIAQKILLGFSKKFNVISGLEDTGYLHYTIRSFDTNQYKDDILRLVKKLDLGIDDILVEKTRLTTESFPKEIPEELSKLILNSPEAALMAIRTVHRKYDAEGNLTSPEIFDMDSHESEGTKKLFALAGPLVDTLKNGKVLLIDELDARLHPLITNAIIELFNSNETNPHNAQLIFITHDTNLLSNKIFRRDQIWFAEKDKQGATHLYSLVEYKIRRIWNNASFESDYIHGKYGAIPFIGDLRRVIAEFNE